MPPLLGFRTFLHKVFCAPLATPEPPIDNHPLSNHNSVSEIQEMPPHPRPGGFVPPHLLKEISKSEACSPESRQAAAETLRHDESRATTPKSSQDKQDRRDRGTSPSSDGGGDSDKSEDGAEGRASDPRSTAATAGGKNPFKKTDEKPKQAGGS